MRKGNRHKIEAWAKIPDLVDVEPFSRLRIVELVVCIVAVVVGVLYLNGSSISLRVLLPTFSACFIALSGLRIAALVRAKVKKPSSIFFAAVLAILAVAMTALTVVYLRASGV